LYALIVKKWHEIDGIFLARLGSDTMSNLVCTTFDAAMKLKN
jgi:hypothetical protein